MVNGQLGHLPATGPRVVLRSGENVPVGIIELLMISAIVVTGPPRFFPEQCVLRHCFRSQNTMLKFPCALQLVQAVGADVLKILSKHLEKFESPD